MLVYSTKNVRGTAGFEALCLEPENEADCQAIDTLLAAVRVMTGDIIAEVPELKLIGGTGAKQTTDE